MSQDRSAEPTPADPTPPVPKPDVPKTDVPKPDVPKTDDGTRWTLGIKAVLIGVVGIGVVLVIGVVGVYAFGDKAVNVGTITSPAIAAIASITAAYFGISLGQEGTKAANDTAAAATQKATDATAKAGDATAQAAATKAVALTHAAMLSGTTSGGGGGTQRTEDVEFDPSVRENLQRENVTFRPSELQTSGGSRAQSLTPDQLEDLIRRSTTE